MSLNLIARLSVRTKPHVSAPFLRSIRQAPSRLICSSPIACNKMEDEYKASTGPPAQNYTSKSPLILENNVSLPNPTITYNTYGTLNASRSNCVVVCHALTGNTQLDTWWDSLVGDGRPLDTKKYFVVGVGLIGAVNGETTGPRTINSSTGRPWGKDFPDVTVRDSVKLQVQLLKEELGVKSVQAVVGGSFGGMQTLEYMVGYGASGFIRSGIPIACGAQHTAWQIGISETQRQCIYMDPLYEPYDFENPPMKGLEVARQIGMVSYRTAHGYQTKFGRNIKGGANGGGAHFGSKALWDVKTYLEGLKFRDRMDPLSYIRLTEQMDTHDVGRGRGGIENALGTVTMPALVLGINSDVLYPLEEQKELFRLLGSKEKEFVVIDSNEGHDGFLLEHDQVGSAVTKFLSEVEELDHKILHSKL